MGSMVLDIIVLYDSTVTVLIGFEAQCGFPVSYCSPCLLPFHQFAGPQG